MFNIQRSNSLFCLSQYLLYLWVYNISVSYIFNLSIQCGFMAVILFLSAQFTVLSLLFIVSQVFYQFFFWFTVSFFILFCSILSILIIVFSIWFILLKLTFCLYKCRVICHFYWFNLFVFPYNCFRCIVACVMLYGFCLRIHARMLYCCFQHFYLLIYIDSLLVFYFA